MRTYEVREGKVILYANISRGSNRYYICIPKVLIDQGLVKPDGIYRVVIEKVEG